MGFDPLLPVVLYESNPERRGPRLDGGDGNVPRETAEHRARPNAQTRLSALRSRFSMESINFCWATRTPSSVTRSLLGPQVEDDGLASGVGPVQRAGVRVIGKARGAGRRRGRRSAGGRSFRASPPPRRARKQAPPRDDGSTGPASGRVRAPTSVHSRPGDRTSPPGASG